MAGKARANLRQLADALNLSVTTVSRALKDGPEVHRDTIRRVKAAAEAAGYVPNLHGRALRTGSTKTLMAILPLETKDYLADIAKLPLIEGMTLGARDHGYSLMVFSATPDEDPQDNLVKVLQSGAADGIIITRMLAHDPRIAFLVDTRMPFITFGRSENAAEYAFVDIDNDRLVHEATSLLIDRGFRRIALQLLSRDDQYSAARLRGYRGALASKHIPFDADLVGEEDFTVEASERWMMRMLALPDPPNGLVAAGELGLLGALSALRSRGLSVGKDFSIAVRDNTRIARHLSVPMITHTVDMVGVGRALVDGLISQIEKPGDPPVQRVFTGDIIEIWQ